MTIEYEDDFSHLEPVKSEKDYWEKHKYYSKKINNLLFNIRKNKNKNKKFTQKIDEFERLMKEMAYVGVVSPEFAEKKINRIYKEMGMVYKFRGLSEEKKEKAVKYLKNKFSKAKKKFKKKQKKNEEKKD